MKWNLPKEDKIKVSRNFALFPIEMDEGKKIWLEFYYSCEIYCNNYWLNVARSQHLGILRRQFHKWRKCLKHENSKELEK